MMAWVAVGLVIKTNTKIRRIFKAVNRCAGENELAVYKASAHVVVARPAVSNLPAGCRREKKSGKRIMPNKGRYGRTVPGGVARINEHLSKNSGAKVAPSQSSRSHRQRRTGS
jgi:hypothetical protein